MAGPDDDLDRAQYLAWSRTWETLGHLASVRPQRLSQRLVAFFEDLCVQLEPTHSLEIGAHEATFSRWAADHLPAAHVTAFEANPWVHEKFAPELAPTRVDYLNLCVGPVTGEIELILPRRVVGGGRRPLESKLASLHAHTRAGDEQRVMVPSVRLEDHLTTLGDDDRVVAWIDVEGAIGMVLEGSGSVLDRTQALIVEVENQPMWEGQWLDVDVAAHLRRCGLIPVARDITPRSHQYNVVFVRAGLALDPRTAEGAAHVVRRPPKKQDAAGR